MTNVSIFLKMPLNQYWGLLEEAAAVRALLEAGILVVVFPNPAEGCRRDSQIGGHHVLWHLLEQARILLEECTIFFIGTQCEGGENAALVVFQSLERDDAHQFAKAGYLVGELDERVPRQHEHLGFTQGVDVVDAGAVLGKALPVGEETFLQAEFNGMLLAHPIDKIQAQDAPGDPEQVLADLALVQKHLTLPKPFRLCRFEDTRHFLFGKRGDFADMFLKFGMHGISAMNFPAKILSWCTFYL